MCQLGALIRQAKQVDGNGIAILLIQLSLNTVSISLTSMSVSDRFVADKACSGFNYHHFCGIKL